MPVQQYPQTQRSAEDFLNEPTQTAEEFLAGGDKPTRPRIDFQPENLAIDFQPENLAIDFEPEQPASFTYEEALAARRPFTFEEAQATNSFTFEEANAARRPSAEAFLAEPVFDPSKPYEEVATPRFEPSKPYDEISPRTARMAAGIRATLGIVDRAVAAHEFAVAGYDAIDSSQLSEGYQPDESSLAPLPGNIEPKAVRLLPGMASNLGKALTKTIPFPRVTAQEVTDAFSMLASMSPDLTEEESQAVIDNTMKPGNLEKIVAGAQRAAVSIPESFTSVFGAGTLGTGALGTTAGRIAAGAFSAHMASQVPAQISQLKEAIASGDSERITEASGNLLATGGMMVATGRHALTKPNPAKIVGEALLNSIEESRSVQAQPDLVELAQHAPLTARALTETGVAARGRNALEPTAELKPGDVLANLLPPTTTPLTTRAVESVTQPKPAAPSPAPPEGEQPLTTTAIAPSHVVTVEIPVARLTLSKDVPNFKGGASEETGTVTGQELSGKYERTGTAPVVAWERLNGDLEIITGRHRLDLARRTGEETIPTQIVREAEGFTKAMALTFDAEANIRDGQGEISDYATYFRHHPEYTEEAARARGLLSRPKGRAGWNIGKNATDDLYALWRDGKVTDAQAVAIAHTAPGDAAAQRIGSKFALQGKSGDFISNVIKASQAEAGQRAQALDLFGNDDAAMVQMAEQATRASQFQTELRKTISAISGAAKNPEIARREGVDLKDPAAVQARVNELKAELIRWADWPLHPDLVAKVRGQSAESFLLAEPETVEAQRARMESESATRAEREAKDKLAQKAAAPLTGGTGDLGQGDLLGAPTDLFAPKPPAGGINTGALGEMGMGGAKPGEFAPGRGTATGIKNAVVDSERQARGQPPILAPQRLANPVVWDAAMARIDNDPGWQDRLIDELKETPRSASAEEVVALDHRYVDLQNEYAKATRDGAQHYKDGYDQGVQEATERAAFYEGKLNELEQVVRKIGTEAGRAFQMRQRLINEDFTLAAMEARARASKGFVPLTEAEHAQISELHAKLAEAERKAAETEAASAERISLLETQKALAEARAAAAEQPLYEPRVLQAAEKFARFMDAKGEAALARIKARLGQTSAGVDPTILSDVAILGAAKITRGAVDFAKWTEAMTRDLGEWFKEHAQAAWDASQQVFNAENNTYHQGDKATSAKVRRAATDIAGRLADTKAAIEAKAKGEGSPLHGEVRKLVRILVEQNPSITRDALIDAVHGILKESLPETTRLEAMDAISGRGKFWLPDQGEVSRIVRDLGTQIRLVAHQLDVEAGKPLPRTGYQPEKLSDAARHEQQKLNELKRKYGVVVTDPAAQLGSVLAARKTYYGHRISDLKAEIAARERTVRNRSLPPTDAALEALKADYAKVKAEHEEIFGKRELTDAQRLKLALAAAERNEASWNERLADAKKGVFDKKEPGRKVTSPELEAIKARTEAVKDEVQELRDIAFPKKTPDQIALQSLKTRLAREKADLTERLATGDFSPMRKPAREIPLDDAAAAAKAEVTLLREQFQQRLERHKYELKSRAEKIWLGSKEALNLSRAVLTSWDVSAVFRQGGFIAFGNPLRAARALGPMFDALRSEKRAAAIEAQILSRPNAPLYAKSKLFLAPREGAKLTGMEEAFMSRLASKIPGVAASNRAYITFLNKLRADTFDALHESLISKRSATQEELNAISNFINVATGRGDLGKAAVAAETMATVFFAPRLVASRFQLLAGQPLYRGSARTRFLIAREYGKFAMGLAAVYGLGVLAGATVETDPRSSDFGKLKFGNTRVDPLSGLAQTTVLVARLATGEKTNLKGKVEPIRGKVPYGKDTAADVIATFLRTKLSPVVGSAVDVLTGKNVVGEPVTAGSVAVNAVVPLSFRDIYDVMVEQGIPEGTAIGILSLLGMSVQNYQERPKK